MIRQVRKMTSTSNYGAYFQSNILGTKWNKLFKQQQAQEEESEQEEETQEERDDMDLDHHDEDGTTKVEDITTRSVWNLMTERPRV